MRVAFLPSNVDGSGCYRMIFPMAYLGGLGHEASMPSFTLHDGAGNIVRPYPGEGLLERIPPGDFTLSFYEETVPDADVYVFQLGSMRWQYEWAARLKEAGKRVVLDMDDNLHQSPKYNPAVLDPVLSPDNNRRFAQRILELADLATFATPALERFYRRWCERTVVLPNCLHWPMWGQLAPVYERREWRRFRVGYMGNMIYHRADLETIADPLRRFLERHPDVEFVAAGDPAIHDVVGTPAGQRVTTSKVWYRNMDLPFVTSAFDVGLVPLVRNDFNEGKSYLKGLEYSGCGIVPVVSATEPYREFVADGESGFVCRHPREFVERLECLLADDALRGRMGCSARSAARERSLDRHIGEWEAAYASVGVDADRVGAGAAA